MDLGEGDHVLLWFARLHPFALEPSKMQSVDRSALPREAYIEVPCRLEWNSVYIATTALGCADVPPTLMAIQVVLSSQKRLTVLFVKHLIEVVSIKFEPLPWHTWSNPKTSNTCFIFQT